MKIVTILGARPQFIKASSLSRELAKHKDIDEIIVHTGQHFDANMSQVFFEEMEIPKPKYNLNINSLTHGAMTGRMLEEIEKVLLIEKPDWVVVYGDTNSTLAGAIAAKKLDIKVAHIEAGLRSYDMKMPEEINRILTDQISNILFCPTQTAVDILIKEGIESRGGKIVNSGDIMYDSAVHYRSKMTPLSAVPIEEDFILATIHRQENTDDIQKLRCIINAFNELYKRGNEIIVPLHPRTKKLIDKFELETVFTVVEPVSYLEMIFLLDRCKLVITDSGGLQKEAYFFGKYCVTLRESTEWVELVENKVNSLLPINDQLTVNISEHLGKKITNNSNLYGYGNCSEIVVNNLVNYTTNLN